MENKIVKTVEQRALQLLNTPEAKWPPLARRFVQAYESEYGCYMDVFLYALRRYGAIIEKLPKAQPEIYDAPVPNELARLLKQRDRVMRKFLAHHTNKPSLAAKYRDWERA